MRLICLNCQNYLSPAPGRLCCVCIIFQEVSLLSSWPDTGMSIPFESRLWKRVGASSQVSLVCCIPKYNNALQGPSRPALRRVSQGDEGPVTTYELCLQIRPWVLKWHHSQRSTGSSVDVLAAYSWWMCMLLREHPQFLGHRKKPSWVFAPQPRRCLHRPSSSQQLHAEGTWVCKCRVQNSSPSGCGGCLCRMSAFGYPKFDGRGPG